MTSTLTPRSARPSVEVPDVVRRHGATIAVVAVVLVNVVVTPNFASTTTLWNVVIQSAMTMLVALGITLTIATGGIDLTVGAVMALTAALTAVLSGPIGPLGAVIVALAVAAGVGALNGLTVSHLRIQPLILTLAGMLALRGVAQVVTEGRVVPLQDSPVVSFAAWRLLGEVPSQAFVSLVAVFVVGFIVRRTTLGVYVEAIGDNPRAAVMAGVPTRRVLPAVYLCSALLAGAAGVLQAGRLAAADSANIGDAIHLDAIAAVAIGGANLLGGRPNVVGTAMGVLLIQVIDVMLTMNDIPYAYSLVLKALIIVVAVCTQLTRRTA
jgi:ribose/xylose/arabinose/galactoside ABC-type transport system permease subunit